MILVSTIATIVIATLVYLGRSCLNGFDTLNNLTLIGLLLFALYHPSWAREVVTVVLVACFTGSFRAVVLATVL